MIIYSQCRTHRRMNARTQQFHLAVESRQVKEAVLCIFHTLLLHRSVGKCRYETEGNYKLGAIGFEEVDCEFVDLSYIRVNSPKLVTVLGASVDAFADEISSALYSPASTSGRISLEFYQKRKRQWPLPEDHVPWEVWQLQIDVVRLDAQNDEYQRMRDSVAEALADTILSICSSINRPQYLPKMPTRAELSLVFDASIDDCQPYLFRVAHQLNAPSDWHPRHNSSSKPGDLLFPVSTTQGLTSTMKKLLKDTLSL